MPYQMQNIFDDMCEVIGRYEKENRIPESRCVTQYNAGRKRYEARDDVSVERFMERFRLAESGEEIQSYLEMSLPKKLSADYISYEKQWRSLCYDEWSERLEEIMQVKAIYERFAKYTHPSRELAAALSRYRYPLRAAVKAYRNSGLSIYLHRNHDEAILQELSCGQQGADTDFDLDTALTAQEGENHSSGMSMS